MLEIDGVRVQYGAEVAIDDLTWQVGTDGSVVTALLGPSGCGKSTLIRTIAGLEAPAAGRVVLDGVDLRDVPTHRRDFGVVFQDGQLFPGRSVASNIGYGLRMRGWTRAASRRRVGEVLDIVRLPDIADRSVDDLSGGQAQRVALARALAPTPRLLLLDEPLAALDRRLRDDLAVEIAEIVRESGTPTIIVTHDHTEAAMMADEVSVMRAGAVVQSAPPQTLWRRPVDDRTARFLGCTSIVDAVVADGVATTDIGTVHVAHGDGPARLGLRPESVVALGADPESGAGGDTAAGTGVVSHVSVLPSGLRLRVSTELGDIVAVADDSELLDTDDRVVLRLVADRVAVIGA